LLNGGGRRACKIDETITTGHEERYEMAANPGLSRTAWLVTCEFIATCMDVRETLGGDLNVEY
jgi:hypothetical protein